MTSLVKPEWFRLSDLDVSVKRKQTTLHQLLSGQVTVLFIATNAEHEDTLDMFKSKWNEELRGSKSRKLMTLAIPFKPDTLICSNGNHLIKEKEAKKWDISCSSPMCPEVFGKWLDSFGIPKIFHPGYSSEEDCEGCSSPRCSIDYPIILLVDPDLTIRKSLFGLKPFESEEQNETIRSFLDTVKEISTKVKRPAVASPAMAGAGISADEILSFMVE